MEPTGKQKNQEQPVEEVLEELRAKLKWTQGELEAQREAERHRQLQVGTESLTWETPGAWVSQRTRILAGFLELGVRAGVASSWLWQMILGCLQRKIQLFFQIWMAKSRGENCCFLHYSAPSEGI